MKVSIKMTAINKKRDLAKEAPYVTHSKQIQSQIKPVKLKINNQNLDSVKIKHAKHKTR